MKTDKNIGDTKMLILWISLFLCVLLIGVGIIASNKTSRILNLDFLIPGAFGSFFGAIGGSLVTLWVSIFTQNRNWDKQRNKEEEKRQIEEKQLFTKFFMELNYNRRKIVYVIKNDDYKLPRLDNFHWKNFIYSRASLFLFEDEILINDLAILDSMVGQVNYKIQSIKEIETATICKIGHSVISANTSENLRLELREYACTELKPYIDKTIGKLEKLYKKSITRHP